MEIRPWNKTNTPNDRATLSSEKDAISVNRRSIERPIPKSDKERRLAKQGVGWSGGDGDLLLIDLKARLLPLYLRPETSGPLALKVKPLATSVIIDARPCVDCARRGYEGEALGEGDWRVGRGAGGVDEVDDCRRGLFHDQKDFQRAAISKYIAAPPVEK